MYDKPRIWFTPSLIFNSRISNNRSLNFLCYSQNLILGFQNNQVTKDIARLMEIQCYRGIRHSQGLPCRGQRTHTNARTWKGKAIPVAGKKKA